MHQRPPWFRPPARVSDLRLLCRLRFPRRRTDDREGEQGGHEDEGLHAGGGRRARGGGHGEARRDARELSAA